MKKINDVIIINLIYRRRTYSRAECNRCNRKSKWTSGTLPVVIDIIIFAGIPGFMKSSDARMQMILSLLSRIYYY